MKEKLNTLNDLLCSIDILINKLIVQVPELNVYLFNSPYTNLQLFLSTELFESEIIKVLKFNFSELSTNQMVVNMFIGNFIAMLNNYQKCYKDLELYFLENEQFKTKPFSENKIKYIANKINNIQLNSLPISYVLNLFFFYSLKEKVKLINLGS